MNSETVSSKMGDLLLRGWAMLEDVCPKCYIPIMENKRTSERVCVSCGGTGDASAGEVRSEAAKADTALTSPVDDDAHGLVAPPPRPASLRSPGAAAKAAPAGKDVSQILADKMIAGWAMLDQHCPRCGTVLLRNRKKEIYCVSCEMFARVEGETPPAAPSAPPPPAAEPPKRPAPSVAARPAAAPSPSFSPSPKRAPVGAAGEADALATYAAPMAVRRTVEVVARKLADLATQLDSMHVADRSTDQTMRLCGEYVDLLQKAVALEGALSQR